MPDQEMIERMAKDIAAEDGYNSWETAHEKTVKYYSDLARAAIKAMREPTQAQYDALCATNKIWSELDSLTVWQIYIDAVIK